MEKFDVRQIIDRISQMQYYKIIIPLEDELEFRGPVPFDIKINKDGLAQFTILASSYFKEFTITGKIVLQAPALSEIAEDKQLKMKLWSCLRIFFNLDKA